MPTPPTDPVAEAVAINSEALVLWASDSSYFVVQHGERSSIVPTNGSSAIELPGRAVVLSSDSERVVVVAEESSAGGTRKFQIHRKSDGSLVTVLEATHPANLTGPPVVLTNAISADGKTLFWGPVTQTATGKNLCVPAFDQIYLTRAAYVSNGAALVLAGDGVAETFTLPQCMRIARAEHYEVPGEGHSPGSEISWDLSSDGRYFATQAHLGSGPGFQVAATYPARVVYRSPPLFDWVPGEAFTNVRLRFSADSKRLIISGLRLTKPGSTTNLRSIRVYDVPSFRLAVAKESVCNDDVPRLLADASHLECDGRVLDLRNPAAPVALEGYSGRMDPIYGSPNGDWIVGVTSTRAVLWSSSRGKVSRVFRPGTKPPTK